MKLASLLVPRRFVRRYPTVAAELRAVQRRAKALCFEELPVDDAGDLAELAETARALGLALVQVPAGDAICAYVLHLDQSWRIEMHQALRRTTPWTDALAALESQLLGYTAAETRAWLADLRRDSIGWGMATLLVRVTPAQLASLARVGGRYLPAEIADAPLDALVVPHDRSLRADAYRRLGRARLLRFGVPHGTPRVVGDALNAVLQTRVQVLTPRGWRDVSPPR